MMNQAVPNPRMQAEALKRMGRGPDTQLIHMTDSEIDALNGLSGLVFKEPLRTNPETGLPEAGLFKRLLPTVLAIGAGAFLGPAAAGLFGKGALATGLGTGLAAGAGHLAGQAVTGQDLDFGRALLAGAGSGLMAGFGAAGDASTIADAAIDPTTGIPIDAGSAAEFSGMGAGSAGVAGAQTPVADALQSMAEVTQATGPGGMRTFSEGFDYLARDLPKRVVAPLAVAGVMGEFDEPLPEAPADSPREPFVPKKFRAERSRRDLDLDEDGEVTQVDISRLVEEGLPEGQDSRFFTPTTFTPIKTGGLVGLQTGGNIREAIQSLTGGQGASLLPMLAQSVIDPSEEEEEEASTKGYPLGRAGTPAGVPTTGISIGGGQPPQPFQTGGDTGSALDESLEGNVSTLGQPVGSALLGAAFGPLGSIAGSVIGSEISQAANKSAAEAAFDKGDTFAAPVGFANPEGVPNINTTQSFLSHIPLVGNLFDSRAQQTAQNTKAANETLLTEQALTGLPTKEQQLEAEAEAEAAAATTAASMAALGMDLGDRPEDTEPGNPGVPGSQASVAQGIASLVSQAMDSFVEGAGPGPGSGPGVDTSGFEGVGSGPGGGGAGADAGDSAADDGPGGTGGADDYEQGGYLGGVSGRAYGGLLQLAGGGSVPYFEGRVMPTGNLTEDGMSDNIPFVIAGRQEGGQMGMQPAVLSPDEYVIPADVVSMLGNGSSTAGANDLDQFINNFRMDKYGRPKQPPEMSGGLSSLA